jgi:glucose-6-phosphate 1-epimerase
VSIALPSGVTVGPGRNDVSRVSVRSAEATAEVYLHGAHVTAWQPAGAAPVLWVSRHSRFEAGAPIRGGVPICFPWFAAHATDASAPAHGFARLRQWQLADASSDDGRIDLRLSWRDDEESRKSVWPHRFSAEYRVSLGKRLSLALDVANAGDAPIAFEAALHTYFAVSDIRTVTVTGLAGTEYLDKVAGLARRRQGDAPIGFDGETDRIYLDTEATCTIDDPGLNRRVLVAKHGSLSTIVWNPWIAKARAMPDFGDDEWPGMLCIETANVGERAVRLEPGSHHTMTATITVE